MLIPHPILGLRDSQEFTCLGDARLLDRPDPAAPDAAQQFHDYAYLRDNPAGVHRELWFHEQGDRSWLIVTRNTLTHEVLGAELARDAVRPVGAAPISDATSALAPSAPAPSGHTASGPGKGAQ